MKLENQVVSLDLAKRLKEVGVKQESLFVWYTNPWQHKTGLEIRKKAEENLLVGHADYCAAFTVAELGEMLPEDESFRIKHTTGECNIWRDDEVFSGDTETDARAKMLIYLLENKLISNPAS